jgi:hypothetical protein
MIESLTFKRLMMYGLYCAITYEGSSEIKSSHKNTYNRQYQTFSHKPGVLGLSLS